MGDTTALLRAGVPLLQIVVRTAAVYVFVLLVFRVTGKREIGQFTLFDLVLILLVANAVQTAMVGPDTSLVGGIVSAATLVGVNFGVGFVAGRVRWVHRLLVGEATQLIADGTMLTDNLKREGVDEDDLMLALHEHELEKPSDAASAWLETDGSISVVPRGGTARHTRRHVRQVKHG